MSAILLLGETGSGKGVLARHIHETACAAKAGRKADGSGSASATSSSTGGGNARGHEESPFVHVNCTSLPPTLIESELFGHEKGAFTDARAARRGLFELADGGTIFLDEIGDMPLELQSKLLIVVEKGIFRRIGGSSERKVHARIIAATNHNLAQAVAAGRFRQDLYYRLNALTVLIPPLREREDDAVSIARALLEKSSQQLRRPVLQLSAEAEEAIRRHTWPGNVRELANAVHRAALLVEDAEVTPADLGLVAGLPGLGHQPQYAAPQAYAGGGGGNGGSIPGSATGGPPMAGHAGTSHHGSGMMPPPPPPSGHAHLPDHQSAGMAGFAPTSPLHAGHAPFDSSGVSGAGTRAGTGTGTGAGAGAGATPPPQQEGPPRTPSAPEELSFDFKSGQFTAEAVERQLIVSALRHVHGNVSRASKMLGMNRSSLRYRIERYQLEQLVQELAAR